MDTEMIFEHVMGLYFGEKAYQIAGQANTPKYRREWLMKVIRVIMKTIDAIDTTPRHKRVMMSDVEAIKDAIGKCDEPSWALVYRLIALVGRLLGFFARGCQCHSPTYFQTPDQYFTTDLLTGGDGSKVYEDKKDAVSVRKDLIKFLKEKGLSDFKVALVLNTTEYEVKKLLKSA
jgi:hypothetical protein